MCREREIDSIFYLRYTEFGLSVFADREVKSVHATRATRGYQNLGVPSNSIM